MKAIVFDFDGTILDTEEACYRSWSELYQAHRRELPLDKWINVVGTAVGVFDPFVDLEGQLGESVDRESLEVKRRKRELELIAGASLRPGVTDLLDESRARGLRIGLATSSDSGWVKRHIQRFGLLSQFEAVVTADDVEKVKPDPAIYSLAVKRLGVSPRDAVAIEDSPNGALGAKRAGLVCVVVPNSVTRDFPFPMADWKLDSLAGVGVDDLQEMWRKTKKEATP